MGLLDDVKREKEIANRKETAKDERLRNKTEKQRKNMRDKIESYIPLIEQFCKESNMQYSLNFFDGGYYHDPEYYYLHLKYNEETNPHVNVILIKVFLTGGFWGDVVWTNFENFDYYNGINETKADVSVNLLEKWLKDWYKRFYNPCKKTRS